MAVREAHIFSCHELLLGLSLTTEEVSNLIGDEWQALSVEAAHPLADEGEVDEGFDLSACRITLNVRRKMEIFVIKQSIAHRIEGLALSAACRSLVVPECLPRPLMVFGSVDDGAVLPSIIIVYASLGALFLSGEDHTGDRTAMLLVGALILMVNFQTDLGLGTISYLATAHTQWLLPSHCIRCQVPTAH